jgi:flavorubredoxin
MITLFEAEGHKNLMFDDLTSGSMVQANQHVIVHNDEAMLLDPGGHKVHANLYAELSSAIQINNLKHIFCSHQDPDIVAALNAWLMLTDAQAYLPGIWIRFVTHFGIDELAAKRISEIPDKGSVIELGGQPLKAIPAHYLHSSGNIQLYDPVSKILYSGDLGTSLGADYSSVEDFDAHIKYMEGFHKRYIPTSKPLKMWAKTARTLDIDIIAPQHGAIFGNKELVSKFIDWIDGLTVGVDLLGDAYEVP